MWLEKLHAVRNALLATLKAVRGTDAAQGVQWAIEEIDAILAAAVNDERGFVVERGFLIGGPGAAAIIFKIEHAEPVIAALCSVTEGDPDEYTVTSLPPETAEQTTASD